VKPRKRRRDRLDRMLDEMRATANKRAWVIAALLSGFPPDTFFYSRSGASRTGNWLDNYLDKQIHEALRGCRIRRAEEVFRYRPCKYGEVECPELLWELSCFAGYGARAGLSNWGADFDYRTSERTLEVAEEGKQWLGKDFDELRALGLRELKTGRGW